MRWITRILVTVLVLLLLAAAGIQAVLWSDWPRREVLARLQHETGLIIDARSMRTGWFGRTSLNEVSVRLPLADRPFAQIPELRVEHTALLPMLLLRNVDVRSVAADGPQFHIVEDSAGEWNVQQAAALIAARRAVSSPNAVKSPLPSVSIRNAQISITNRNGGTYLLPAAQFTAQSNGMMEWSFESDASPLMSMRGRLANTAGTPHELHFNIHDAQQLLSVIAHQQIAEAINAEITWNGRVIDGQLDGRAHVHSASLGEHAISGTGAVAFGDGRMTINQPDFSFTSAAIDDSRLALAGGTMTWREGALQLQQSRLHAFGADASVEGVIDTRERSGRIQSQWSGQRDELHLAHRGSITAEVHWPQIGTKRISVILETAGTLPDAKWESTMHVNASGESWREMSGAIAWPKLVGHVGERHADLSGLSAQVNVAWPALRIDDLTLPNAEATGIASFDADTRDWSVNLALKKWTLPVTGDLLQLEPLDVKVQATGTPLRIDVAALDIRSGPYEVNASGTYLPADPQPLFAQALVKATVATSDAPSPGELFPPSPAASRPTAEAQKQAGIVAHIQLRGGVRPLAMQFTGNLNARDLPVGDGRIDSSQVPISGSINPGQIQFESANAALFDGGFDVRGTYRFDRELLDMQIAAREASLEKLARIAGVSKSIQGRASGDARVLLNPADPRDLVIEDGQWSAVDVRTPAGPIASVSGTLRGAQGVYEFMTVSLTSDDTADAGTITGSAIFNAAARTLTVSAQVAKWPWSMQDVPAQLRVSGPVQVQANLSNGVLAGTAEVRSIIAMDGEEAGELHAHITADQRTLHIADLQGNLWDGALTGSGSVALDQLTNSRGELQWNGIDLARIAARTPQPDLLSGRISVSATVQPASESRSLGPSKFAIDVKSHEARSRNIEIGDISISGYAGPRLLIADNARIAIAGGEVRVWGRISPHDDDPFAHGTATFDRLDLNQLVHWIHPEEDLVPGRLSGSATAGGYLWPVGGSHRLFGQSELTLVESDLVNITVFTLIHDALSLSIGDVQPHGEGAASIRLEGNALELSRLEYYNRGTDVVASVRIDDIRLGGKSPITGVAVGAMRPLKKLDLPVFKDFDRALKALQTGAASVRIGGTLESPEQKLVPFAEIAGAFQRILTGSPK